MHAPYIENFNSRFRSKLVLLVCLLLEYFNSINWDNESPKAYKTIEVAIHDDTGCVSRYFK